MNSVPVGVYHFAIPCLWNVDESCEFGARRGVTSINVSAVSPSSSCSGRRIVNGVQARLQRTMCRIAEPYPEVSFVFIEPMS
jgi:hypothetical protein